MNKNLLDKLNANTALFREGITNVGYSIKSGSHPIVPIMLGDAKISKLIADEMLEHGVYVIGFSYPVVPKNEARIRVQISASHSKEQIERALDAFKLCAKKYNILPSILANSFVNSRPFVSSNIVGATSIEQLKENIESINIILTKEILNDIEDIHLSDPNPCF